MNARFARDIETLYKEHYARLLAALVRIFSPKHFPLVEDALQEAFTKALHHWQNALPENPAGWLMQSAKNRVIDLLRAEQRSQILLGQSASQPDVPQTGAQNNFSEGEAQVRNDLLRMMFMCCHAVTKPENSIPLMLKTLCGFSIPAISRTLLLPEATIKKRLFRTRERLKTQAFALPPIGQRKASMETVHTILYLLFNEGYYSSQNHHPLNRQLCQEAIGLVKWLVDEPELVNRDTLGLYALLHFQMGRMETRVDDQGHAIPINLQARASWHRDLFEIACGALKVAETLQPGATGRFIIEAQIAREHCLAPSFAATNWSAIVDLYRNYLDVSPTPVAELNLAIALGYAGQITEALALAQPLCDHPVFKHSHLPLATLAHFHAMRGDRLQAMALAKAAQAKGGAAHEHHTMMQQLEHLLTSNNA